MLSARRARIALMSLGIAAVLILLFTEGAHAAGPDATAGDPEGVAQACDAWSLAMAMVAVQSGAGSLPCPFVHTFDTSVTANVPGVVSRGTNTAFLGSSSATSASNGAATVESASRGEGERVVLSTGVSQPDTEQSFTLCGVAEGAAADAIGRFIAGRPFGAALRSRSDGCADLTISVPAGAAPLAPSGQQSSTLSVTSDVNGVARAVSVQIASENGSTRVSIGNGI